jgi:hypothetical protein
MLKVEHTLNINNNIADFKKSTLYQEYQAEIAEINKHKWLESEKAGHDIGWDRALYDWLLHHKKDWKSTRKFK